MLTNLQRFLLLTVLFSLIAAGHLPSANYLRGGIWEASEQAEFAFVEEEVESESEHHHDLLQNDGSDDGGGGDDEIGANDGNSSIDGNHLIADTCDSLRAWYFVTASNLLSKVQIEAKAQSISAAYRLPLFLLFHNIKSDHAHATA